MNGTRRTTLARALLRLSPRGLYLQGLALCSLLDDVEALPAVTLLMPNDAAFDALPVRFRDLLVADEYTGALFDLFETSIVRGHHVPSSAPHMVPTLAGSFVCFENEGVSGAGEHARVVDTVHADRVLIHVVDGCVLPPHWRAGVNLHDQDCSGALLPH